MLFHLRGEVSLPSKARFHASHQGTRKQAGTPQYFVQYVEYSCRRSCDEAILAFGKHLDWSDVIHNGSWNMTWDEFVKAMGFCRHRIVHSFGRVSAESLRTLTVPQRTFVELCLHTPVHDLERSILPPPCVIDPCFEVIVSHGWGLYILLTKRCGMADESE